MITITAAPIPTDFRGTPQEWLDAFLDRVEIVSDVVGFTVSDEQPDGSNVWLKNGKQIWTWDEDTSAYVPLDVSASTSDEIFVGPTAPDPADFLLWLKVTDEDVVGLFYYMGATLGWMAQDVDVADGSITTLKLADLSVTTNKIANGAVTPVKLADNIPMSKWETGPARSFLRMNAAGTAAEWETPFTTSGLLNIAINSVVKFEHGLDDVPHSVEAVLVLDQEDATDWKVGDEVNIGMFSYNTGSADDEMGYSYYKNATEVGVLFDANIFVWHPTSIVGFRQITPSNWKLKFYITSS